MRALPLLAIFLYFNTDNALASSENYCRAQNILNACLSMQSAQFMVCEYDNWDCKCHGQKKILACYDNCPDSENRILQEMQVKIFCGSSHGDEYNRRILEQMTKPAKAIFAPDDETSKPSASNPDPTPTTTESRTKNRRDDLADIQTRGIDKNTKAKGGVSLINSGGTSYWLNTIWMHALVALTALAFLK